MVLQRKLNLDIINNVSKFEEVIKKLLKKREFYKVLFRGRGLEFDSYRSYSPEDDASYIDWKASLRANELLERKYIEEREVKVMILVDVSRNMVTGSTEKIKCEYSAELSAALAHLVLNSGDAAGFAIFDNNFSEFERPIKGMDRFKLFVDFLSDPSTYGKSSSISYALKNISDNLTKEITFVIIVSDFIKIDKNFEKVIKSFSERFETIAIVVRDPLDVSLPKMNREVLIEDPQTGEQKMINPNLARKIYAEKVLAQKKVLEGIFERSDVDFLNADTSVSFILPLATFLVERLNKRVPVTVK